MNQMKWMKEVVSQGSVDWRGRYVYPEQVGTAVLRAGLSAEGEEA